MKRSVEDFVQAMIARLIPDGARAVTLDEIGDAIDGKNVGPAEIEALIQRLESMGAQVIEPGGEGLVPLLRTVIQTAHAVRRQGASPTPLLIAEKSGLSVRAVRVALLYADVLKG